MILNLKPITGSIQPRDGAYYAVVNLYVDGKRKQPWIDTGYPVKNGKTKAKQFLMEELSRVNEARDKIQQHFIKCGIIDQNELMSKTQRELFSLVQARRSSGVAIFDAKLQSLIRSNPMVSTQECATVGSGHVEISPDMLFIDYMRAWLPTKRSGKKPISETSYHGYEGIIEGRLTEFFSRHSLTLQELTPEVFEDYYDWLYGMNIKSCTALHHHRVISQALKWGVKSRHLYYNVLDQVEAPEDSDYIADYYMENEVGELLKLAKQRDDPLYIPILLAAYYGLRRSEVLGLRWSSIDFQHNRITIERKIVPVVRNGKRVLDDSNRMKTKKSRRTLPLILFVAQELKQWKERQEEFRELFGNRKYYNKKPLGHVCTNPATGYVLAPNFVTNHFGTFLRREGLRKIRYHDLRHTCASLLVMAGYSIYQVAMWLGHSTSQTTERYYAHLDYKSHLQLADEISRLLNYESEEVNTGIVTAITNNDERQLVALFGRMNMKDRSKLIGALQLVLAA